MSELTPETIAELERLEKEATPGPWSCWNAWNASGGLTAMRRIGPPVTFGVPDGGLRGYSAMSADGDLYATGADAQLVAQMRNALPSLLAAVRDLGEAKADYHRACECIAAMHAAAVGEITGPNRGVVEDVADVRAECVALRARLAQADADAKRWRLVRDWFELSDINEADPGRWELPRMVRALLYKMEERGHWPTKGQTVHTVDEAVDDLIIMDRYRRGLADASRGSSPDTRKV